MNHSYALTPEGRNEGMPYSLAPDSRLESIIGTTLLDTDNQLTEPDDFLPAWGQWMTAWDPLENLADKFDAEDIWRLSKPAEQYLYCMEYTPGRGHKDELFEDYGSSLSYHEYDVEMMIYSFSALVGAEAEDISGSYSITIPFDLRASEEEEIRRSEDSNRTYDSDTIMSEEDKEGMPPDSVLLNTFILDMLFSRFSKGN